MTPHEAPNDPSPFATRNLRRRWTLQGAIHAILVGTIGIMKRRSHSLLRLVAMCILFSTTGCPALFDAFIESINQQQVRSRPDGPLNFDNDIATSVAISEDGGYLIAGGSETGAFSNAIVAKVDAEGTLLWSHAYHPHAREAEANVVFETRDGGVVVAGATFNAHQFGTRFWHKGFVLKLGSSGQRVWERELDIDTFVRDAVQTSDGGLVINIFDAHYSNRGDERFQLLKLDDEGTVLWVKALINTPDTSKVALSVIETRDGGLVAAGGAVGSGSFLAKTDAEGNTLWFRTYDEGISGFAKSVVECRDGGFVMLGNLDLGEPGDPKRTSFLTRTDASGTMLWTRKFTEVDFDFGSDVSLTSSGDILVVGKAPPVDRGELFVFREICVLRLDIDGNTIWSRRFAARSVQFEVNEAFAAAETSDGSIIVVGRTGSDSTLHDALILKLDADGNELASFLIDGSQIEGNV